MATKVLIRDEAMNGETLNEYNVSLPADEVTVRELIRSRVYQGVNDSSSQLASTQSSSVQGFEADPTVAVLDFAATPSTPVDWKSQFEKAADAFCTSRIMIFVDDRQVRSLDEKVEINPETEIRFLRLTMLMGG